MVMQKVSKVCEVTCIDLDDSIWVCLKHNKKLTRDTLTGDFLKCTECTEEDEFINDMVDNAGAIR